MLKSRPQSGFSLIELLMVVVIVGILAAVAVPSLFRARDAAEKGAVIANLRTIHSNETTYLSQRGRYARLPELNTYFNNNLGTPTSTSANASLVRGSYYYLMSPTPTNTTLRTRYQIYAYTLENRFYIETLFIMEDGVIDTIIP